jgi:radical SAM superfamily enzyme YgiQ (UPF0313 family)
MSYDEEYVVIRPPSEASSFLLPVTIGCSSNKCTFCRAYKDTKFKVRKLEDIKRSIDKVAQNYSWSVRRVFLENGDALVCSYSKLASVLEHLNRKFPHLERVTTYATPQDALRKTVDELKSLRELGLEMVYLGVESGDDKVLEKVQKGATHDQIVEAGRKIKESGIILSVTVILGLGGAEGSKKHASETARILTEIDPEYAGALTLMLVPPAPLYYDLQEGKFSLISPFQSLEELRTLVADSNFTNCFFTSNHASNYLPLKLRLPKQKDEAVNLLDKVIAEKDPSMLRPEFIRAL